MTEEKKTSTRGFASMDKEKQRAIARKGGETVSRNREHMAIIGKIGGLKKKAIKAARTRFSKREDSVKPKTF